MTIDVIDNLLGIREDDALFTLRSQRPDAKTNAQTSYDALFASDDLSQISQLERLAIAYFTVALSQSPTAPYYQALLETVSPETTAALDAALPGATTSGPYGDYPDGPLTKENVPGLHWVPDDDLTGVVGERLSVALAHTHLLVYRPRDSSSSALQTLLDSGWTTTAIVTLSQLVAFLGFQLRVVAGLAALQAAGLTIDQTTATARAERDGESE